LADRRRLVRWGVVLATCWLAIAYLLAPWAWERYERRHPSFDANPRITQTSDRHPGDPLNVALVGSEEAVRSRLEGAGWFAAASLGLRSDLEIAADTVLSRPDDNAPVSNLYLFGRKEDLAFEQPVGDNPRQRHHVRFWRTPDPDPQGRPIWIGSATYDERVGLSHTTGQITHHIAPDVDLERDHLFATLQQTKGLASQYWVDDFHVERSGRNGGGDPWRTDGRLLVGELP
jgi:hypothetical protein